MVLYRSKFPINNPFQEDCQAIDLKITSSTEKPPTRHVRAYYAIKGFKLDETCFRTKNEAF